MSLIRDVVEMVIENMRSTVEIAVHALTHECDHLELCGW